ncbi:transglutaminaseTgpA domain-containing protein [Arthrobacter sp. NPDC055585]
MTATLAPPQPHQTGPAPSPRRTGQAQWAGGAVTFAAVMLCALSVHGVLEGSAWLWPLGTAVAAVAAGTALARWFRFPTALVPVAGLGALTLILTMMFSPDAAFLGIIPTGATLERAGSLLAGAQTTVITQVIPVIPDTGVVFVACLAVGLVTVLVDTLAITLRMPAASGFGLFTVLLVPAIIKPQSVGVAGFAAAAAGYLLILAAGTWQERRERADQGTGPAASRPSGPQAAGAAAIGAGAVVAALLVSLAIPGFNTGAFPQGARFNFLNGTTGLNPVVTLGNDLRQPTATGRITYATDSTRPLYLRSTTLEDFSGTRWAPDTRENDRQSGVEEMAAAPAPDAGIPTDTVQTVISSPSYASPWLLAPYAPSAVSGLDGSWTWDPSTMTILSGTGNSEPRSGYQVISEAPIITGEALSGISPAPADAVDPMFTDLPANLPQIIRDTAREAVADAQGPYAQALALQSFLRGPDFDYSLEAPVEGGYDGNGIDVLARFLEQRSGYCIHFASAMAVMAREVGIPSRMGLGYAPGRETGSTVPGPDGTELDEYAVDARDAHAWPELYFEGAGWVRFEPTPSRGVVPAYAAARQQNAASAAQSDDDPRELQNPVPPVLPSSAPGAETQSQSLAPEETAGAPWAGVGIGILVAAAAVLTPWALRRRRSGIRRQEHARTGSAAPVWAEATDVAQDFGYRARTADSPRSYADRLAVQAELPQPAANALARLRTAYEAEAYSNPAAGTGPRTGRSGADWQDVDSLRNALRASVSLPVRLRARFIPASFFPAPRVRTAERSPASSVPES